MSKVLLLYGGFSAEREVSISARNDIYEALKRKRNNVIAFDLTDVWKLIEVIKKEQPDVVYNGLYGNWGEDGELQGFLDMLKIPYTHSGLKASVLGMNKNLCKIIASQNGVKTASGEVKTFADFLQNGTKIPFPYVIKPVADGSSVGVFIINNPNDLKHVSYPSAETEVIIERYIKGRELTVMCLQEKSYVVTELKPKTEFYDYKAKYTSGYTEHVLPAEIPEDVKQTCLKYAEIIHKALGCNTLSRSDFRYNEEDGVVFLEINTAPGMTSLSLVPEQAKYAGIDFADLCDILVKNATYRKR